LGVHFTAFLGAEMASPVRRTRECATKSCAIAPSARTKDHPPSLLCPWRSWVRHESDALPSEMKGVHPEKKLSKTGSEAPCAAPRGARQKRNQNALDRKSRAAKLRAVASSKPSCSLVTRNGDAEPLQAWRRQHDSGSSLTSAPSWSSGVAGTARSERKALNVRDLDQIEANETDGTRPQSRGGQAERGVGEARSTVEGSESCWREGASLGTAASAVKDGRLWQH